MTSLSPWLLPWKSLDDAQTQVICFPHAGGAASASRLLAAHVPAQVALAGVELPGRGARFNEPLVENFDDLLTRVFDGLRPYLRNDVILLGHSLGALFAFEVARLSEAHGVPLRGVVVSGHGAAHSFTRKEEPVAEWEDDRVCQHLRELGGTPPEVLDDNELVGLMLPIVRADYRLHESYRFRPGSSLCCPVTAIGGSDDADVTEDEVRAWSELVAGEFRFCSFAGGHHFLYERCEAVVPYVLSQA